MLELDNTQPDAPAVPLFAGVPENVSLASPSFFLRIVIALSTLFLFADGTIQQLEMYLFGGSIPVRIGLFHLFLYISLGFLFLVHGKYSRTNLFAPAMVLVSFLLVDAIHLSLDEGLGGAEIYRAYLTYFSVLILACLFAPIRIKVNEKFFTGLIIVIFMVNIVVALLQFTTNSPVVPTQSNDRTFVVDAAIFLTGQQRAFGLFSNGLEFGLFCGFVSALGVSFCRTFKGMFLGIPLLVLGGLGCYATLTRVAMIEWACLMVSVYVMSTRRWRRLGRWLPLMWVPVVPMIVIAALTKGVSDTSLASSDSMNLRFAGWLSSWNSFSSASVVEMMLGIGIVPFFTDSRQDAPSKVSAFPIDNGTLIVLLYVGMIGLVLLCFLVWRVWRYVYGRAVSSKSHLQIAIAAFWSTALLVSTFNFAIHFLSSLLLISVITDSHSDGDEDEFVSNDPVDANAAI